MCSLNFNRVKSIPSNKYWRSDNAICPFQGTPLEIILVNEGIEVPVCIAQLSVNWYHTTKKDDALNSVALKTASGLPFT